MDESISRLKRQGIPGTLNKMVYNYGRYLVRISLIFLFSGLFCISNANEKETFERLKDENRILSLPMELHLTATDSAMINSTVSLNNEDAWLFFDNIRPSEVIAKYKSSILIGESVLNPGGNGRVAIYKNGAVVMPHGYAFKPLTVYTDENFKGDSTQLNITSYHTNLGDFDNAIQSFKLKRGYMATFANNSDGSGYSRVFIANDTDMEVNMPDLLINNVSFIRVFKYEWVSKKGKAGWNPNDINATSYYDWNIGGSSSEDVEYVAIRQNGGWPSWDAINSKQNITHLLGFNEPDHTDQADMTFQEMIDQWPEMMKSGLRIGSPAWANPWGGNGGTLFDFINKCDELNYRVDFVALHCYWGGKSPQNWYNDLKYIHEQTGRPLWITEWNNGANWTNEWWPDASKAYTPANAQKQLNDIKGILQVLDTASFVERYFIYDWVQDCRAMVLNDQLTEAGKYYNANESELAFNKSMEVIPQWNYQNPELDYRYFSLRNSIRLSWTNSNGELINEYMLEKKVDNGEFKTIYSSEDISQLFYLDPLDSADRGEVTCRLSLVTARGEHIISNEVSWYQSAGDNEIQYGNFSIDNFDINTSFFSNKYSSKPILILGIPSFNNPDPITQRVNNVTTSSYMFYFKPWSYLSDPNFTKSEVVTTMALPAGTYDFGGLKAEAQLTDGVSRDWSAVEFNQQFETIPVVFATIVSSSNPYPVVVGVRNVTSTSFEICLKSEEAITASLSPETINYIAIEPGNGVIDGKRITVGRNTDGNGISSIPMEITFDSTYTEPGIFANLLSEENNFASTLRFSNRGESSFEIIKQREVSGEESEMYADDFGWMVMDMAADQPDVGTGLSEIPEMGTLEFYPNPAENTLYFHFDKPTRIEIVDLTGRRVLVSNVEKAMDISSLKSGTYILKAAGKLPGKFIKLK